ncbi:MAG: peptide-methionine (R)-S-oxide reductase MsrB [Burkholderiales bacterium]
MGDKLVKSDAEWRAQLTPLQYIVTRRRGTERAFTGAYLCRNAGVYRCVCCDAELFSSETQLDSGPGWPCFRAPIDPERVRTQDDYSWFRLRVEASCAACDAHLGHVFDEQPQGVGRRYCINSVALKLVERR